MPSAPRLRFYTNTAYETEPFNFKWQDGRESFSFLVPKVSHSTIEFLLRRPGRDNKADLMDWAVAFIGREWDLSRCSNLAMRVVDGRIEIRLRFEPPWWWQGAGTTLDRPREDGAI